jgi:hypothetical protein
MSTEDIINTYTNLINMLKLEETKDLIRTLKKLKEKFKPQFYEIKLPEYTEEYTDSTEPVEVEEAREEF